MKLKKFRFWLSTVWIAAQLIMEARRHSQRLVIWPFVIWVPREKVGLGEPELTAEEWYRVFNYSVDWPAKAASIKSNWPPKNYGTLWWDGR